MNVFQIAQGPPPPLIADGAPLLIFYKSCRALAVLCTSARSLSVGSRNAEAVTMKQVDTRTQREQRERESGKVLTKEYKLVIERTAQHSIFQACVSPNLSPCSVRQSGSWEWCTLVYYRLGETHVWKTQRGAVRSITNIYSLAETELFCCVDKKE